MGMHPTANGRDPRTRSCLPGSCSTIRPGVMFVFLHICIYTVFINNAGILSLFGCKVMRIMPLEGFGFGLDCLFPLPAFSIEGGGGARCCSQV